MRKTKMFIMVIMVMVLVACGKEQETRLEHEEQMIPEVDLEEVVVEETDSEEILVDEVDSSENVTENVDTVETVVDNVESEKNVTVDIPAEETMVNPEENTQEEVEQSEQEYPGDSSTNNSTHISQDKTKPRKVVDSYEEEIKGEEVPFKYGVTKYELVKKLIAVYDDGTSEVRSTRTYTKYNRENYNATSDELREESVLMTTQNMAYYEEILGLVNEIRAEAGVEPLTLDTTLCQAATVRTLEMDYSGYYSHTRPDGSSCFTILTYYGFVAHNCGENIAAGQPSPEQVVASWKRSQGHYENMIHPSYTKMGVGYSGLGVGEYRHYWCQLFVK